MSRHTTAARPFVPDPATAPAAPALSGGRPLDRHTEAQMSSRFGHDFSSVRVHTDTRAEDSAQAMGASAYALGSDIAFGPGQYRPGSADTDRLLAHELTHVVQQAQSGPGDAARPSRRADASEQEAEIAADRVLAGDRVQVKAAPGAAIARFGPFDNDWDPTRALPNPIPFPDAPVHLGQKPGENSAGYAYEDGGPTGPGGLPSVSFGAGLGHADKREGDGFFKSDLGFVNGDMGSWQDGDSSRIGDRASGGLLQMGAKRGGLSGDFQALTGNAEASIGNDGATLGGGLTAIGGSASYQGEHEMGRFGMSVGPSLAGRLHWGEGKDGYRNYGLGGDVGPFSVDMTTNDPLRSVLPGSSLLGAGNLTDRAAGLVGLTTKNADLSTTADVVSGAATSVWDGAKSLAGGIPNPFGDD